MNFDGMCADPDSDPREALEPGIGEKAVLAEYLALASRASAYVTGQMGEKAVLAEYLDRYRMTFELKCEGLTAEQLATRSVPPSTMSLLGMIRHLARVEHSWTRRVFEGQIELPLLYRTKEDPDLDFNQAVADDEVVAEAWDTWRGEVAHARAVYTDLDLDAPVNVHGQEVETRDIVIHLVEEYARHVGHSDLLRECIDGHTSQ
jgi:uncharacterized damage-inducible protein DinB